MRTASSSCRLSGRGSEAGTPSAAVDCSIRRIETGKRHTAFRTMSIWQYHRHPRRNPLNEFLKACVRSSLPEPARFALKRRLWRNNLPKLAALYQTDKWGLHRYAEHYQKQLGHLKNSRFNLLEIGVGGHEAPDQGGNSLRMWKAFFPHANIFAIDIFDKSALEEERIRIFRGSQADVDFLRSVAAAMGAIDVVVDDGSHVNDHVITSFQTLFPLLAPDGIYAIEDLQTAYWPAFGGNEVPHSTRTSMEMLKALADGLNWEEQFDRQPDAFDRTITSVHFYHNLAFVQKGCNEEGSNKTSDQIVQL